MKTRSLIAAALLASLSLSAGWTWYQQGDPGESMTMAADAFLRELNDAQAKKAVLPYDTPQRVGWHFVPLDERKGLMIREMTPKQREIAHDLLRSALSAIGYEKATQIMALEKLLKELEAGKGRWPRDWEQYYFTIFGRPGSGDPWGLSVEGHHLSLNFVVEKGNIVSSTPQVFCTNPAVVKTENNAGIPVGTRVLEKEETLAFDLVNALSDEQKLQAVIAEKAPGEIRDAGKAQPPQEPAVGITYGKLTGEQQGTLRKLIQEYADAMPRIVAQERMAAIEKAGYDKVHFAWAGAMEPGIGHSYRVQGPTFLIEFVNVQPDAAGNPANHIHSIWRDMRGDFAIPVK